VNDDLEMLQEKISDKYQFRLDSHVMTLFGVCRDGNCEEK
jgi:Fe2+ or Zn2+ uptake regulation protein